MPTWWCVTALLNYYSAWWRCGILADLWILLALAGAIQKRSFVTVVDDLLSSLLLYTQYSCLLARTCMEYALLGFLASLFLYHYLAFHAVGVQWLPVDIGRFVLIDSMIPMLRLAVVTQWSQRYGWSCWVICHGYCACALSFLPYYVCALSSLPIIWWTHFVAVVVSGILSPVHKLYLLALATLLSFFVWAVLYGCRRYGRSSPWALGLSPCWLLICSSGIMLTKFL